MVAALTSGCVVGRRTVGLDVPAVPSMGASKGEVAITSVADNRRFENEPKDPSTPSIDGDVKTLTSEGKAMMIGRQRNTYGGAMGDIALPAGQSVPQQTRSLVEAALRARGYNVTSNDSAPAKVSASIDEFWAWFTPGMFSVTFEARINCALTLSKDGKNVQISVLGYGKNSGQAASDENWKEAYDRAYKDFLQKLDQELAKAGL